MTNKLSSHIFITMQNTPTLFLLPPFIQKRSIQKPPFNINNT